MLKSWISLYKMPKENNKILKYNRGWKPIKPLFVIYTDLEPLLQNMSTSPNNPKRSSTTKITKYLASSYSLFSHCLIHNTKSYFIVWKIFAEI